MSDNFSELISKVGRKEISPDAFVSQLMNVDERRAINFIAASLTKYDSVSDTDIVRCLLKSAYHFRSKDFGLPLIRLLKRFLSYSDHQLFEVASELELIFTILAILKVEESTALLEQFAERIIEWDDVLGLNRSAIHAIANIGDNGSLAVLRKLSEHKNEEVADAAKQAYSRTRARLVRSGEIGNT